MGTPSVCYSVPPKLAHLLPFLSLLAAIPTATIADFISKKCDSTGTTLYAANSTFESNLKTLLSSLFANGSAAGYYNGTAGEDPDRVYGLILCRGDVSAGYCQHCLGMAELEILDYCPGKRSAVVWYTYCMLRFSDQRFFSVPDDVLKVWSSNDQNVTEVTLFNQQLNLLMARLVHYAAYTRTARMFAVGEADYVDPASPKIYGLVQCTLDQSPDDCNTCLKGIIGEMPSLAFGKKGARYLTATCNFRYELDLFYKVSAMVSVPLSPSATAPPTRAPLSTPPIDTPSAREKKKSSTSSTGTVLAIAIPVGAAFALISVICFCLCRRKTKEMKLDYMRDTHENINTIESLLFDLSTLRIATANFSELNLLGQGGFGSVYKGLLPSGQVIAVKRLSAGSGQGVGELKNEVVLLAKLQHRNLVRLLGVCLDGEEKLLVYEYVPNRSLDKFLFDPALSDLLNWETRYKIMRGIARGLQYLHEESQVKIIHRDLKASNILLDADMNPKISDFGMARLFPGDQTQATTSRVVGTFGYMAPEYVMIGQFSNKSDVFSFGVLVLEMITGKRNTSLTTSGSPTDLLGWVWEHWRNGTVEEIVDPSLSPSGQFQGNDLIRCIQMGLMCVQEPATDRPAMSSVVLMLSSASVSMQVLPSRPAFFFGHSQPAAVGRAEGLGRNNTNSSRPLLLSSNEVSVTELEPR